MNTSARRQLPPTPRDAAIARSTHQALSSTLDGPALKLVQGASNNNHIPAGAVDLLTILEAMPRPRVTCSESPSSPRPGGRVLTSPSFLIKLLGQKPSRIEGSAKRFRMEMYRYKMPSTVNASRCSNN